MSTIYISNGSAHAFYNAGLKAGSCPHRYLRDLSRTVYDISLRVFYASTWQFAKLS